MKYIRTLLTTAIFTLAIAAGFNWFIDPYGMYWSPLVEGLNVKKPEAGNRSRTSKPYVLSKLKPTVLIVGNSRVEMGLNPEHLLFDKPTYNIGIPGLGMSSQIDFALNEIESNANLEHIILSLDYLDFLHTQNELAMPVKELITRYKNKVTPNNSIDVADIGKMLFSLETTKNSFLTIVKQSAQSSSITQKGFNTAKSFISIVKNEGKVPLFSQKLMELNTRLTSKIMRHHDDNWEDLGPKFVLLKQLIRVAQQSGIKLTLFINPYHISYLQLLKDLNYWSDFLLWKVHLNQLLRSQELNGSVSAYDFSGINNITSEKVQLDKPNQRMQWFWEPAHYTSEAGNIMLPILLGQNCNPSVARDLVKSDLNFLISSDNQALKATKEQWKKLKERLKLTL
jgi:hypothetical protein